DRARGRGPRDPRTVDLAGLRVRRLLGRPAGVMPSALHTALEPAEPAAYLRGVQLPLRRTDGRTARFLRLRLRGGGAAREQMLASLPLGQARLGQRRRLRLAGDLLDRLQVLVGGEFPRLVRRELVVP